jgi:hypothetical protein
VFGTRLDALPFSEDEDLKGCYTFVVIAGLSRFSSALVNRNIDPLIFDLSTAAPLTPVDSLSFDVWTTSSEPQRYLAAIRRTPSSTRHVVITQLPDSIYVDPAFSASGEHLS